MRSPRYNFLCKTPRLYGKNYNLFEVDEDSVDNVVLHTVVFNNKEQHCCESSVTILNNILNTLNNVGSTTLSTEQFCCVQKRRQKTLNLYSGGLYMYIHKFKRSTTVNTVVKMLLQHVILNSCCLY